MRKQYLYLLALALPAFTACNDDDSDVMYHIENPEDQMIITPSASEITLSAETEEDVALTFTWNDPADRGAEAVITTYFRMDVADNNFETATDLVEIPTGQNSISFTGEELNDQMARWGIAAGSTCKIEAEIIADVENESIYLKPEISKVIVTVTGFKRVSKPLSLWLDEEGFQLVNKDMTEVTLGKEYYVRGWFDNRIGCKFVYDIATASPAVTKGVDDNHLVITEGTDGELFHSPACGFYKVEINTKKKTVKWVNETKMYLVGDAAPCGWDIQNPNPMTQSTENPAIFYWDGHLTAGELKCPVANPTTEFSWSMVFIRPVWHLADWNGDNRLHIHNLDYKWKISREGDYHVEMNLETMKSKFTALD